MHYFLDPLRFHYIDFKGRAGRKEFWMYILSLLIVNVLVFFISAIISSPEFILLCVAVIILPTIAITIRRLNDSNINKFWIIIVFIPLIGQIVMVALLIRKSRPPVVIGPDGSTSITEGEQMVPVPKVTQDPGRSLLKILHVLLFVHAVWIFYFAIKVSISLPLSIYGKNFSSVTLFYYLLIIFPFVVLFPFLVSFIFAKLIPWYTKRHTTTLPKAYMLTAGAYVIPYLYLLACYLFSLYI